NSRCGAGRHLLQGGGAERQSCDNRADVMPAADELRPSGDGVRQRLSVALAADLDQEMVPMRVPLETLRVMAAGCRLQARRRRRGDRLQLALVEETREPGLGVLRGIVYLEVDRASDVANLVSDEHVGDEGDGEDRNRRQREHQPETE